MITIGIFLLFVSFVFGILSFALNLLFHPFKTIQKILCFIGFCVLLVLGLALL